MQQSRRQQEIRGGSGADVRINHPGGNQEGITGTKVVSQSSLPPRGHVGKGTTCVLPTRNEGADTAPSIDNAEIPPAL